MNVQSAEVVQQKACKQPRGGNIKVASKLWVFLNASPKKIELKIANRLHWIENYPINLRHR